jgi:protein phosphatase
VVDGEPPWVEGRGSFFIVADGLGGYTNGGTASQRVCDELPEIYYQSTDGASLERFASAVAQMNTRLFEANKPMTRRQGMYSTFAAAVIVGTQIILGHVGDSKAYLFRGGEVLYESRDHCVRVPSFDAPGRRFLTQSLGWGNGVAPVLESLAIRPGDVIVLCSDGLSDLVSAQDIAERTSHDDPFPAAKRLLRTARSRGATDDVSLIIVKADHATPLAG